jgi:hypothetical protein
MFLLLVAAFLFSAAFIIAFAVILGALNVRWMKELIREWKRP